MKLNDEIRRLQGISVAGCQRQVTRLIQARSENSLRWLYAPWACLVFVPFFFLWTALVCTTIVLVSRFGKSYLLDRLPVVWARPICWANLTSVEIVGKDRIVSGQSYVVISNHQSQFDILAVNGYLMMPIRWVMKASLRKVPFLGSASDAMGHVFIDRSQNKKAIASLKEAWSRVSNGVSVLFFPEGTRSPDGRLRPFKKGAFKTALDLDLPILPISITGSFRVLPKGSVRPLPGHIQIKVHEPVDVGKYGAQNLDQLMADTHQIIAGGLVG